jgi:hypothetical protein
MIILIFAAIIFGFLLLGALVFVVSILLPFARERALSAALWCAVWGPCIVALLTLAGFALGADALAQNYSHFRELEHLSSIGLAYAIIGLLGTAAIASLAAWLHQSLIHRMTFALFRVYACLVSFGIGSVFCWAFVFWLGGGGYDVKPRFLLLAAMLAFCTAFGYGGFRYARYLRGEAPQNFTWITSAEFEGECDSSAVQQTLPDPEPEPHANAMKKSPETIFLEKPQQIRMSSPPHLKNPHNSFIPNTYPSKIVGMITLGMCYTGSRDKIRAPGIPGAFSFCNQQLTVTSIESIF